MSKRDFSLSVESVYAEYGVNAKIDVTIKGVEIDDLIDEVGYVEFLDSIDNDNIISFLEDEGYIVTEQ